MIKTGEKYKAPLTHVSSRSRRVARELIECVPDPSAIRRLLGHDTVMFGSFVIGALSEAKATQGIKTIDLLTRDFRKVSDTLLSIGYTAKESTKKVILLPKVDRVCVFAPTIRCGAAEIQVFSLYQDYADSLNNYVMTYIDFDICRIYFNGSSVFSEIKTDKKTVIDIDSLARARGATSPSDKMYLSAETYKRAQKYRDRGFNIDVKGTKYLDYDDTKVQAILAAL